MAPMGAMVKGAQGGGAGRREAVVRMTAGKTAAASIGGRKTAESSQR